MNLTVNARDAMPRGGTLRLSAEDRTLAGDEVPGLDPGNYVVIEALDTGTGVPPEVMARIFEPFFTTKGDKGTGLGLSTSFGAARRVGGTLTVSSLPDHGAAFRLYLPRAA
jgi:two-component system cell cycle sensor histidine kinase/response regulator CckA